MNLLLRKPNQELEKEFCTFYHQKSTEPKKIKNFKEFIGSQCTEIEKSMQF